ncbi:MAG: bifunctional 4-hydroxy-2-oxoglutarate aldolase/2-dehydro-3-deoxy-phosphogluconate aldolase [Armatimonadota bacterium]
MSNKEKTLNGILECGVAAVVRAENAELASKAISAAIEGGVNVIEVTFTVPGALDIIKQLAESNIDGLILGAGTVTTPDLAEKAIDNGAEFIVSPNTNLNVIEVAKKRDVPMFPGALTPTEVFTAYSAGADIVKIFPANVMGPTYLKDIHGPFPKIPLMPTGGVDLNTAMEWLECGAVCLGVGGALINKKLMADGNFAEITSRAKKFTEIVKEFRSK